MNRRPPKSPLFPYPPLFRSPVYTELFGMPPFFNRGTKQFAESEAKVDRKSTRLNSSHSSISYFLFFFLNEPAPPEISPLSLPAALPISCVYRIIWYAAVL